MNKEKVTMNKIHKIFLGLAIVLVTYANGIVSTKFLNDKNIQLQSLIDENKRLSGKLNEYETEGMDVTVLCINQSNVKLILHRTFSQMERV